MPDVGVARAMILKSRIGCRLVIGILSDQHSGLQPTRFSRTCTVNPRRSRTRCSTLHLQIKRPGEQLGQAASNSDVDAIGSDFHATAAVP